MNLIRAQKFCTEINFSFQQISLDERRRNPKTTWVLFYNGESKNWRWYFKSFTEFDSYLQKWFIDFVQEQYVVDEMQLCCSSMNETELLDALCWAGGCKTHVSDDFLDVLRQKFRESYQVKIKLPQRWRSKLSEWIRCRLENYPLYMEQNFRVKEVVFKEVRSRLDRMIPSATVAVSKPKHRL